MPDNKTSLQKKVVKKGRPTKYRAKKHIRLLIQVFSQGGSIGDFCKIAGIGRSTFYSWCRIDPRFHNAFDIAICHAAVIWEKLPLVYSEQKINLRSWMCVMRNRFRWGLPKFRARDIRDDTALERMKTAYDFFQEGEMSLKEFEKVVVRERDLLKAKIERDLKTLNQAHDTPEIVKEDEQQEVYKVNALKNILKVLESSPEGMKDVEPTQTPEKSFPASCGDSVAGNAEAVETSEALLVLLKTNKAEGGLPVR